MSLRAVASSFQSVNYQGTWDASTNNPTLTSSVGTKGSYYVVSVAGSTNLNGITNWGVGDWAVFNGSAWQRVEGGADGNFVNLSVSGTASINSTLGVKTNASGEYNILVGGNLTGGANSGGLRFQSQIQSDVTSNARGIMSIPSTAAASFTINNLEHFFAGQGSLGAGSAVTSQYGYRAASSLTGATNNYGFYGDIASGTGRWNFYAAGTANNYFAGNVGLGTTTPGVKLDVADGFVRLTQDYAIRWHASGTNRGGILADSANNLIFQTGASLTEKMRIDNAGNVGINVTANASALLDVQSTTKGVRMPNMTTTEKNAIASPAAGLIVFDTTLAKLCVYTGAAWQTITSV